MNTTLFVISAILAIFFIENTSAKPDKVVCYYSSWSVYRKGQGKFDVPNIDPKLCTHLNYAFVGIKNDASIKILDAWNDLPDDGGLASMSRFIKLKQKASGVKALVSIGGWSEGGKAFSKVAGKKSLRQKFAVNAVKFLKKYHFDGLDIDWEYPANEERGGHPADVQNFSKMLKELRAAFQPHGYLLTAAVAAAESEFVKYYQVPELNKYLDFINVMTYDLHGSWEGVTGINAPLYPSKNDHTPKYNVKACIEAWIKHGADPKKIVLGMGAYGNSFTLANSKNHGLGAKTTGPGKAGKYTDEKGTLGFNEIVESLKDGQLKKVWQDDQKVPYAYHSNQWVGYDDEESIQYKSKYAVQKGLGGGMVWSIDTDDFQGFSGTKFALLKAINKVFGRKV